MSAGNPIPPFVRMTSVVLFMFTVLVVSLPVGTAQPKEMPLTDAEVLDLLQNQVPIPRIIELVRQNGISFEVTAEIGQRLRKAGATKELLDVLAKQYKAVATQTPHGLGSLSVKTKPGGAQVYLDDEFKGETSPQGDLHIPGVSMGDHRMRADLSGYQTWEDSVTVTAGETMTAFVTLVPKAATPSVNPRANPVGPSPEVQLPAPGAKVNAFQFFETPHDFPPLKERSYSQVFNRDSARYIAWELRLVYPRLDAPLNVGFVAIWRDASGKVIHTQNQRAFLQAGWVRSVHAMGWGPGCSKTPCQPWAAGAYTVEIQSQGHRVALSGFQMR